MRLSQRLACAFTLSLLAFCPGAWAGKWVPSWDKGAYVENIKYGAEYYGEYGYYVFRLKVSLENTEEFTLHPDLQNEYGPHIYQALLTAKADSLPVLLYVDTTNNTFSQILIGTVDPDHPVSLRMPAATPKSRQGGGALGFDPLGRIRSSASARVPLVTRPVPAR